MPRSLPSSCAASRTDAETAVAQRRVDDLLEVAWEAKTGSATAVRTLVLHIGPPMLMTVRKILGAGHPDLDDVAQDAVIALLNALGSFRGDSTVLTFAHRIALLTALAARRRNATRHRYHHNAALENDHEVEHKSPQSLLLAKRRREQLIALLDELPTATAEALALHFVLGMTVDEIAEAAQSPQNTIWSRLRLGKQALKRKLTTNQNVAVLLTEAE